MRLARAFWCTAALFLASAVQTGGAAPLLLEVHINGRLSDTLARFETEAPECDRMEAEPLVQAGLYPGGQPEVCLQDIAGLEYSVDPAAARIDIFADPDTEGFVRRRRGERNNARQVTGLIGEYAISAQRFDDGTREILNGFGDLSLALSGEWGRLRQDAALAWDGSDMQASRTFTVFERDDPDRLTRLSLGDGFTRAPRWARLSAFAGVQYGTDFSMDPEEAHRPYRAFQALLREQSEIAVRVNGSLREQRSLPVGVAGIELTPETGLNEVEITIRDQSGLTQIEEFSFFFAEEGLARGVTDYSVSLGVPRQFRGVRSEYHGGLTAMGLVRRGVTDALTVETYAELGRNGGLAGGGGQLATDRFGVLSLAAAASHDGDSNLGALISAGIERRMRRTSFQFQGRFATDQYRDGLAGFAAEFPDVSLRASAGIATSMGSFRTSYTAQRDMVLPDRSFLTFGWERSLAERPAVLSASAFHDFCRDETGISISLRMQVGKYSVRPARDEIAGQELLSLQVARLKGPEDHVQWGVMVADSQAGETVHADVLADFGPASVFLTGGSFAGTSAVSAGARGGFTAFAGRVSAVRQASGAAVIVNTPGIAGLDIYQDNRLAAVTDVNGKAVIGNVRPYEANTLSVRPQDVPLEFAISSFELNFVPQRGVSEVRFDMRRQSALAFTARRADGRPLAEGSRVYLSAAGQACPVGLEGRVYCAEADDADLVIVQTADGSFAEGVASLRQSGEMWLAAPARLRLAEAF